MSNVVRGSVQGRAVVAVAMAAATLLAGCGYEPATSKRALRRAEPMAAPVAPPPVNADAAAVERARAILAAVDAKTKTVTNWQATATSEVVGPGAGDKNWNTSKINFKHPSTMAATVVKAKDGKAENTRLVYHGGNEVSLKTYFFGFLAIKIDLPVDDGRLVDAYKRSLRDTQTKQLFTMLLHPQAQAAWVGEGLAAGEPVDFIDVRSPESWKGVTHEVVGVSRRLALPISRDCFDAKNRRIFHLELKGMKINFTPKAGDFTLD